jgi:hypothetical protein
VVAGHLTLDSGTRVYPVRYIAAGGRSGVSAAYPVSVLPTVSGFQVPDIIAQAPA